MDGLGKLLSPSNDSSALHSTSFSAISTPNGSNGFNDALLSTVVRNSAAVEEDETSRMLLQELDDELAKAFDAPSNSHLHSHAPTLSIHSSSASSAPSSVHPSVPSSPSASEIHDLDSSFISVISAREMPSRILIGRRGQKEVELDESMNMSMMNVSVVNKENNTSYANMSHFKRQEGTKPVAIPPVSEEERKKRNAMVPPHLRASYAIETQEKPLSPESSKPKRFSNRRSYEQTVARLASDSDVLNSSISAHTPSAPIHHAASVPSSLNASVISSHGSYSARHMSRSQNRARMGGVGVEGKDQGWNGVDHSFASSLRMSVEDLEQARAEAKTHRPAAVRLDFDFSADVPVSHVTSKRQGH
eukprot:GILI01032176.1.p1 GENE.GILI01032176.1~~GILI01032176.1.p1  ORF type:complete len:361 (+),score=82.02 GILI01032176.1:323-1405(+)